MMWRTLNTKSGMQLRSIVEIAVDVQNLNSEHREKCVKYLARHIELCLDNFREYRSGWCVRFRQRLARNLCIVCGRRYGNYLVTLYLTIKVLCILNDIGQVFFLNAFLGGENHSVYGLEVLNDLRVGRTWRTSGKFPRVTMCDFQIRQLGNIHRHTVQCVLPINMLNEKIFLFLWWWYFFITVLTVLNLLKWSTQVMIRQNRTNYVKQFLKVTNNYVKGDAKLVDRFVNYYLRQDGLFTLCILSKNVGEIMISELITTLWKNYKHRMKRNERQLSTHLSIPLVNNSINEIAESDDNHSQKSGKPATKEH